MTITAVFESLEEMQEFAGKLNGGSIQGAVQEFIKGEDIYRTSETKQQTCMQDEISEDRETPEDADEPMEPTTEQKDEGPGYTLVQVREKLSELQKAGKRAQVQELIAGFGVKKLTEIPEDKYSELMQKAGEL